MEETKRSNPKAAQVRIQARKSREYSGQRNHDLRRGAQPSYVDREKIANNEILIEPPAAPALRKTNEERRKKRVTQRAMRSDAAVAFTGILTFGHEAQETFEALSREDQAQAFLDAAQAVAERLKTTVEGLVIHRDETAVHAHFTLAAYDLDGNPMTATIKRGTLSDLQDVVAGAFQRHAPEIERGRSVAERLASGATRAETLHKSVRELHEDLPKEVAAKRAEVTEAQARVDEMRARVIKLEQKEALTAAELKRLATYRKRLEDRIAELESASKAMEQQRDEALTERNQAQAERDAAHMELDAARMKAARITSALQVLAEEIAEETIGRNEAGKLVAQNPAGLREGFPDLRPAVLASAAAIDAKKRAQAEAEADREKAASELKAAQKIRAELSMLRSVLQNTLTSLRHVLKAAKSYMQKPDYEAAEKAAQRAEELISPKKPSDEANGPGF